MDLHTELFESIEEVRYVALANGSNLELHERPSIQNTSDNESDKYEELLVNPAILLLAKSRGEIDCGGMKYVVIRYGNFYQLVYPTENGHISVAIEPNANLDISIQKITTVIDRFDLHAA